MSYKPIIHISHVNINLDAFDLLNVNGNEYMFLAIVAEYQKINGWAAAGVGNNLRTKTGLKYHIGRKVKLSDSGTDKLFKRMLTEGYLEESNCGNNFRCSINYFVLTHSGKNIQQHDEERKAETAATSVLKFAYNETTYYTSFDDFKNEALTLVKKLPTNVNLKHYFDEFRRFYTTENTKAYSLEGWKHKIKTWITQDRDKGKLKVLGDLTEQNEDELINEIRRYGKMVAYPTDFLKYSTYREQAVTLIEFTEKAEAAGYLGKLEGEGVRIINYKNSMKKRVNERGELVKYMKERQAETVKTQEKTEGNSKKQQETDKNTEGVKMANLDLSQLAKTMNVR